MSALGCGAGGVRAPFARVPTLYPLALSAAVRVRFFTSYRVGSQPRLALAYMTTAPWICRRFDAQAVRIDDSRAFFRLGSRIAIRSAMIPMTTRSSTSVNAAVEPRRLAKRERSVDLD